MNLGILAAAGHVVAGGGEPEPEPGDLFTPSITTGLLMFVDLTDPDTTWQDAARTVPATVAGHTLMGVTDKSGTGRHWSAPSAALGATLEVESDFGNKCLRFANDANVGNHVMNFASAMTTVRTVLWLMKFDATVSQNYQFPLGHATEISFHGGSGSQFQHNTYSLINSRRDNGVVTAKTANRPTTLTCISGRTSANGSADRFSKDRAYSSRSWSGDLVLLLAWSALLSDTDMATVEGEVMDHFMA